MQPGGRGRLATHPLISGPCAGAQAAAENGVSERVTTAQLDWSAEEGVPEGAPFELVLAADPNPSPSPSPSPSLARALALNWRVPRTLKRTV